MTTNLLGRHVSYSDGDPLEPHTGEIVAVNYRLDSPTVHPILEVWVAGDDGHVWRRSLAALTLLPTPASEPPHE